MFKFITDKPFWVNLLVVMGLVIVLFLLFFSSLGIITRHSSLEKVPAVIGKNVDEARAALEGVGFEVVIQDSVYIDTSQPLSVVRQAPEPDAIVKAHRTIYLTVNRALAPLVAMPNLNGFSFKSAQLYLISLGLRVGDTSYVPDIALNAVKKQMIGDQVVKPGTQINMGTPINLVLGSGVGEDEINVPDLIGMTVADARLYVSNKDINISAIIPTEPITDTANAYVSRQSPAPYSVPGPGIIVANKVRPGQLIDIWISNSAPPKDTANVNPQ